MEHREKNSGIIIPGVIIELEYNTVFLPINLSFGKAMREIQWVINPVASYQKYTANSH